MRVCKTRIAAWLLALLVNAFFVIYLLTAQRRAWVLAEPSLAQNRVQLYFISPPTPELPAAAVKTSVQLQPKIRVMSQQRALPETLKPAADEEKMPPAVSAASDMRDDWFSVAKPQPREVQAGNFAQDPLRRRPARLEATGNRMALEFRDTSLGGRLRGISQASICKELRQQLSNHPASASAILASMARHGCIKDSD